MTEGLCGRVCRYAFYALVFGLVYVVGFPLGVLTLLYRHRSTLFGDEENASVATTRRQYGFLYEVRDTLGSWRSAPATGMVSGVGRASGVAEQVYGPSAWWWEVEELIRKLLLSAVVVLIEPGSPLQV